MHHQLHLMLFGAAVADHAGFDFERRVLAERETGFGDSEQRHAARVRELERGLDILRVEDLFHRGGFRLMGARITSRRPARDDEQAGFERLFADWYGWNRPRHAMRTAIAFDHAVAGVFGAAIDAENAHVSARGTAVRPGPPISFSSTSKLE